MNSRCYLVIGSTGFIGQSIVSNLCNDFNSVYTISRTEGLNSNSSKHYVLDLLIPGNLELVINELQIKYTEIRVFYLAGLTSVNNSMSESYSNLLPTIQSYVELIDCIKETNSSLIFASSGAVYDGRNQIFFDESSSLRPISSYSVSKQCCENISITSNHLNGLNIKIARLFSVFGENMNRFFIFDLVKKLLTADKSVSLMGDGNQIRDYLHVDIVSKGLIYIMDSGVSGETYNLCSGTPITLKELSESIRDILGKSSIDIIWNNNPSIGSYDKWYGNPSKIYNLGFQPSLDFEANLEKTVLSLKDKLLADT